jgi:glucosamine-6-phosphate deaminase
MISQPSPLDVLPASSWGEGVAQRLARRLADRPELRLCLPTGSTPRPIYAALPDALAAAGSDLSRATVVLLDEYLGLPAGHRARCDQQLRSQLIERLPQPPARLITFDVDAGDPAALGLTEEVRAMGGLDLALLGLGLNGHIGMNEPGTPADAATRIVSLAPSTRDSARRYGAEQAPSEGVTLGLAEILAAREIWLLVTGAHKAGILDAVLNGPMTPDVPASLLRGHPGLRVLADSGAAQA